MLENKTLPPRISLRDGNYITLKRAADLMALENSEINVSEFVEEFKYAIFAGEFEPARTPIPGIRIDDDRNYPIVLIEAPSKVADLPRDLPREDRPKTHYGYTAESIIDYFDFHKMFPSGVEYYDEYRKREDKAGRTTSKYPWLIRTQANLACIRFVAFPEQARAFLLAIYFAKSKLIAWLEYKGNPMPAFLAPHRQRAEARSDPAGRSEDFRKLPPTWNVSQDSRSRPAATASTRGRPPKARWHRIGEIARELRASHPTMQCDVIAFEAHKRARLEFPEKDLPKVTTIIRRMKSLLCTSA